MNQKNKLLIIACSYTLSPSAIIMQLNKKMSSYDISGVIISNNNKYQDYKSVHNFEIIAGSNCLFEFSAYHEGITNILEKKEQNTPILIINDTLFTKHNSNYILKKTLCFYNTVNRISNPVMVGRFDPYNNILYSNPWNDHPGYISSFCMLVNHSGAEIISSCYDTLKDFFPDNGSCADDINNPDWGAGVNYQLREFIRSHLLDIGTETSWYQANNYKKDISRLDIKGKCVFMEHYISGVIGREGILISIIPTWKGKVMNFINEQIYKLVRRFSTK